jgi:uncharacterized membrane protein
MSNVSKQISSIVLVVVSLVILVDFFWANPTLKSLATDLNNWAVVIGAFALGLGAYSLLTRHSKRILQKKESWIFSVLLLATMFLFIATGLITGSVTSDEYNFIYALMVQPLSSALYGMNAFFIASASYRAFKAKNVESGLLLVAAIFLMLKNAPIGEAIHPILPQIGSIFWDFAGATGMRAILIGIGIGTLAIGLRIIIGQEKTPLGGAE